jgi:hypothetical protein
LPVDIFEIEPLRLEIVAQPVHRVLMVRMGRVLKRLQIVGVGPNASAVFPGGGALPRHATGISAVRFRRENLLNGDHMLPVVAEIVFVEEPGAFGARDAAKPGFFLIADAWRKEAFRFRTP